MTTTHPRAQQLAQTMQLPLTICSATKELYGYAKAVLDIESAKGILFRNGVLSQAAIDDALFILHDRVSRL
ncbi:MAG: hypothetical protein CTY12_00690 [Methylotenera sp.]|nr:MAG: hypothetical protein CTY12_00690 [Methylotenera sp.]